MATSPDLPGLIVQADTPEEVIRLAPDIARDLIEVMQETGQPLPASRPEEPRQVVSGVSNSSGVSLSTRPAAPVAEG